MVTRSRVDSPAVFDEQQSRAGRQRSSLYLTTVAMVLVGAQIWLGRKLSWPKLAQRRRWHFWVIVGLVAFILAHVALDSALVQTLLPSV